MSRSEYEEMWQNFVTSTRISVGALERLHHILFLNDGRPTYSMLSRADFRLLLWDFESMYLFGRIEAHEETCERLSIYGFGEKKND